MPHVRMMKTGYEKVELAKQFGLPYVILHAPRPFDTATLNYNWQIWETNAFSIYTPMDATIAFVHDEPMTYENTAVFKLFPMEN